MIEPHQNTRITVVEIDKDTVLKIARLARVRITEDEVPPQKEALSKILTWVEQLSEVNTDQIEPLTSVHIASAPLREDVVNDGDKARCVLSNAPEKDLNMYAVPKVVE